MFSIIIPVFNGEKTIKKTIQSCLNQKYPDFEILIIDNASIDRTKEIVKEFSDERISYIYTPLKGRSNARNIGINNAEFQYILFLDADDEIDGMLLFKAFNIFSKGNVNGFSYATLYKNTKENSDHVKLADLNWKKHLYLWNPFPINSVIINKEIIDKKFNTEFDYNEDWLFWYDNLSKSKIYTEYDYIGAIVNIHENNTMRDRVNMTGYEMIVRIMIKKRLSIITRIINLPNYLKFMYLYKVLEVKVPKIDNFIKRNSFIHYNLVELLLKIPFVRNTLKKKLEEVEKINPFLY